jgi:hypothetical protein
VEVLTNPKKRLSAILWLVALHSLCVGLGLILVPPDLMGRFGYNPYQERFFSTQAGVFHFVMVTCYCMGASNVSRYEGVIILSIAAKFIATVFLLIYYFFVDAIWVVLASGLADFAMGVVILWAFRTHRSASLSPSDSTAGV